jgi:hypothetical protein
MQTLIQAQETLLNKISSLTVINQLVETIYVDESIGQIEVSKTNKDNNVVRHIVEKLDYKLKSHRLLIKSHKGNEDSIIISDLPNTPTISSNKPICQCVSSDINQIFTSEIKSFKNTQKFKYNFFKQNLFKKMFKKNTEHNLVDYILELGKDCSWVIVPPFIFDIIKDSEWFDANNYRSESLIYNSGKLSDDINVYVNPDEDESVIYFGNYDSISIIINRNIKEDTLKTASFYKEGKSIVVDYLFLETGTTKYLLVE